MAESQQSTDALVLTYDAIESEHSPVVDVALLEGRRDALADAGVAVSVYSATARAFVGNVYSAACTTELGPVRGAESPHELPRDDAHYLRRPALLERALDGSLGLHLDARRLGGRARRALRRDYLLSEAQAG